MSREDVLHHMGMQPGALAAGRARQVEALDARATAAAQLFTAASETLDGVNATSAQQITDGLTPADISAGSEARLSPTQYLGPDGYEAVRLAPGDDGKLRFELASGSPGAEPKPLTPELFEQLEPAAREKVALAMKESLDMLAFTLETSVERLARAE